MHKRFNAGLRGRAGTGAPSRQAPLGPATRHWTWSVQRRGRAHTLRLPAHRCLWWFAAGAASSSTQGGAAAQAPSQLKRHVRRRLAACWDSVQRRVDAHTLPPPLASCKLQQVVQRRAEWPHGHRCSGCDRAGGSLQIGLGTASWGRASAAAARDSAASCSKRFNAELRGLTGAVAAGAVCTGGLPQVGLGGRSVVGTCTRIGLRSAVGGGSPRASASDGRTPLR